MSEEQRSLTEVVETTEGIIAPGPVIDVAELACVVEAALLAYLRGQRKDILDWITNSDPKIKGADEQKLKDAIADFAKTFA